MKTALITGATGGIGGKTAEVLGQAGYEVIVNRHRRGRPGHGDEQSGKQGHQGTFL